MHEKHKEICDHFVYIPQYTEKTASLNVSVAGSIIFHHFAGKLAIYRYIIKFAKSLGWF